MQTPGHRAVLREEHLPVGVLNWVIDVRAKSLKEATDQERFVLDFSTGTGAKGLNFRGRTVRVEAADVEPEADGWLHEEANRS